MKLSLYLKVSASFICFTLISCTLPSYTHRGLEVQVVEPGVGQIYLIGSDINVVASSYQTGGGENITSRFLFFANSNNIGEAPATPGSDISARQASIRWRPTVAGEYQLQTEAITSDTEDDRGGVSTGVKICVLDLPFNVIRENIPGDTLLADGYSGPCPLPPPNPTNLNDTSFDFGFVTETCSTLPLRFIVRVERDPSDQLALIVADITWGAGMASIPVALSPSGVDPSGVKLYTGGWSPPAFYDGTSSITVTYYAFGRNGSLLGSLTHGVNFTACTPGEGKTEVEITPTNTPASVKDCPPGTYFAEATFQCIPIQINPDQPGGGENPAGNSCPNTCNPGQDQLPYPNCSCIG